MSPENDWLLERLTRIKLADPVVGGAEMKLGGALECPSFAYGHTMATNASKLPDVSR